MSDGAQLAPLGGFILLAALGLGAAWDLRTRRIPNQVTLGALAVVLALTSRGMPGLAASGEGMAIASIVGLVARRVRLMGGGDLKLLVVAGVALGPQLLGRFCLYTALSGGLVALVFLGLDGALMPVAHRLSRAFLIGDTSDYRRGARLATTTMPMAVPMLLGGVAVVWQSVVR